MFSRVYQITSTKSAIFVDTFTTIGLLSYTIIIFILTISVVFTHSNASIPRPAWKLVLQNLNLWTMSSPPIFGKLIYTILCIYSDESLEITRIGRIIYPLKTDWIYMVLAHCLLLHWNVIHKPWSRRAISHLEVQVVLHSQNSDRSMFLSQHQILFY